MASAILSGLPGTAEENLVTAAAYLRGCSDVSAADRGMALQDAAQSHRAVDYITQKRQPRNRKTEDDE